jgi:hypothetical protein
MLTFGRDRSRAGYPDIELPQVDCMPKPSAAATPAPSEDAEALASLLPVHDQIRHFLSGATNGRSLLEALYGKVADEPGPERLKALLRR